jgi:aryl-alcohol dehydrogenase-like predicted oxidoreductase
MVSSIGLGGFHIGSPNLADSDVIPLIHKAIDRGITFLDNSWDYNAGMSELRMGRALTVGGYRDRVFLMTKIDGRTKAAFNEQFEQSLSRLLTDHIDLVQFHENIRPDDADRIFAPGGALEAAIAARDAGKVRYIGFTGHKDPKLHLHMIELADKHGFAFDTVQMPLNVMDAHFQSFEQGVLPVALAHGTAVLGMKTFGDPFIFDSKVMSPIEMLHYPMSLPIALQVCGIDHMPILQQALEAVRSYRPLTAEERTALLAKSAKVAADGSTERYKVSHYFDGTIQNPQWLG